MQTGQPPHIFLLGFPLQRHQERRRSVARSHEEDSLQHPGPEGPEQLTQRVRRVIPSLPANPNALTEL